MIIFRIKKLQLKHQNLPTGWERSFHFPWKVKKAGGKEDGCKLAVFHVRGGDYSIKLKDKKQPHVVRQTDYIQNSLLYLKEHYKQFRCAVIGDQSQEQQDVYEILKQNGCGDFKESVLKGSQKGVDFVTLMKSDIVVVTHGAFGIYAAYLGNHWGDILFPDGHPDMRRFGLDKHFLPRFKPINWNSSTTFSA
ncbi:uncharacterized protein LOC142346103 [Convolutriloba macropyga]|uniref:uncharacterized protein LOC142346103 n=1 Tax=Convolutriloba macropyga TaxID=536237 RepID=UPI003F5219FD